MERTTEGWGSGLLGVIIFSGSLPATRVAVGGISTPLFLTSARAVIAAVLARSASSLLRQKRPGAQDLALARHRGPRRGGRLSAADGAGAAAHHRGALDRLHRPVAARHRDLRRAAGRRAAEAAVLAVLDPGQRHGRRLRPFASDGGSVAGDLLMVAAILLCGLGYAEGATLSRRLGGWQVISWALCCRCR